MSSDANARLGFLWKASHILLSQCPGASSHYMSQFLSLANNRDLRLHEDIQTKSCAACGSIFVPGVNTKVRLSPVKETKLEREKRKKAARKRAKMAHSKDQGIQASQPDATSNSDNKSATLSSLTTTSRQQTDRPSKSTKKTIHITPYSELVQQQQQQQRRQFGGNADGKPRKKIDKRANQILNHIIYSCQRCNRETELPGTKEGYLAARVKVKKPVSQRRRIKKEHQAAVNGQAPTSSPSFAAAAASAATSTPTASASGSTIPTPKNTSKADVATFSTATNPKRPASPLSSPAISSSKRLRHAASMPASPVGGLSVVSSAASSAATSPASSQRLPGLDGGKSVNSNKKKKKTGLASLLASQKAKDTSSDPNSGADGDSVLANFLLGL